MARVHTTKMLHDLSKRLPVICSVDCCGLAVLCKGLCARHYGTLQVRLYREKNPEYVKRQGRRQKDWYKKLKLTNPEKIADNLAKTKKWRVGLKNEVFEAYGGYVCNCCGELQKAFLTIDHIHGGGTAERRKEKLGAYSAWSKLKKQGFPPGYQVLCMNCNFAKYHQGICPHQKEKIGES